MRGPQRFPSTLARMYEQTGKPGVTLALVSGGLAIILWGFAFPQGGRTFRSAKSGAQPLPRLPFLYPSGDEPDPAVGPTAGVVLRTRKYLPQESLSGTLGVPSRRRPR